MPTGTIATGWKLTGKLQIFDLPILDFTTTPVCIKIENQMVEDICSII